MGITHCLNIARCAHREKRASGEVEPAARADFRHNRKLDLVLYLVSYVRTKIWRCDSYRLVQEGPARALEELRKHTYEVAPVACLVTYPTAL